MIDLVLWFIGLDWIETGFTFGDDRLGGFHIDLNAFFESDDHEWDIFLLLDVGSDGFVFGAGLVRRLVE